jgi:hypothetical protein
MTLKTSVSETMMSRSLLQVAMMLVALLSELGRAVTVPMISEQLIELLDLFQNLVFVPALASTPADFDAYKAEGLFDVPRCPMKYRRFSCDANGSVDWLELDVRTDINQENYSAISTVNSLTPVNFTVRNFFGLIVSTVALKATSRIVVENSWFGDAGAFWSPFLFGAPNLVLTNVSLPLFDLQRIWTMPLESCRFTNVTLLCPVPDWLAVCFGANVTGASAPCVRDPVIPTRWDNTVYLADRLVTCDAPRSGTTCGNSRAIDFYVPAVPGFNVIEVLLKERGEAYRLTVSSTGVVARVDLWDWLASNWTRVLDRVPERSTTRFTEVLYLPPVVTNRVRLTVEQWSDEDRLFSLTPEVAIWPERAALPPIKLPLCGSVTTLSTRSMLDETLADSFCIDRVCQQSCLNAQNFTFGRPVRPLYLVVEGGERWSGATLVATPSAETRVYELPAAAQQAQTNVTNAAGLNLNGVRRVRLVGTVDGVLLPTSTERKGMTGIFVKWLALERMAGAALALNGTSAFDGRASAPFVVDASVSVAAVLASTFAFADGQLWRADRVGTLEPAWAMLDTANALTRLVLNRGEVAHRVLVGLDDGLLAVVSASVRLHDGSMDRLLTNRVVQQMSIDVLNVRTSAWYPGIVQHDIARNLSDIDVVQWNRTRFGVVDRASGRVSVIEYRAFPYTLVPCDSNRDCASCIGNVANEESCRWCGARCAARGTVCMPNETSTIFADRCDNATTSTPSTLSQSTSTATTPSTPLVTTATATTPSTPLLTTTTAAGVTTVEADEQATSDNSSTVVGLAVGIPIAVLVLVAIGLAAVCAVKKRKQRDGESGGAATATATATDTELPSARKELPSARKKALPPDEEQSSSLSLSE